MDLKMQSLPDLVNYIGGKFSEPELDRQQYICDSNTAEAIQLQKCSSEQQAEEALHYSDQSYISGEWEHSSLEQRAEKLDEIAEELSNPETIDAVAHADAVTTGVVIRTTSKIARMMPFIFKEAAAVIRQGALEEKLPGPCGDVDYFRSPWGPALLISPWNGPTAIGAHKIASALAAGAPCILKPSEWAPHSAVLMARAIDKVGLPEGTFQLACGNRDMGGQLVRDARIKAISFTGGLRGGRAIARACADNFVPTQLELGGNNQLVVLEDADLDKAATGIVFGLTNLNAQWCRALGRIIVHQSQKAALLDQVMKRLGNIRLGSSLSEDSDMGPMVHSGQYEAVLKEIDVLKGKGGTALNSTPLPDLEGYFIAPTLIDGCSPDDTRDEIFGPVASIHTYQTEEEALALANGTELGLAGYVYGENLDKARSFAKKMRTGGVKINGYSLLGIGKGAPRSAWGLSGLGEEGSSQSIEFFTGARVVGVSPQDDLGGTGERM